MLPEDSCNRTRLGAVNRRRLLVSDSSFMSFITLLLDLSSMLDTVRCFNYCFSYLIQLYHTCSMNFSCLKPPKKFWNELFIKRDWCFYSVGNRNSKGFGQEIKDIQGIEAISDKLLEGPWTRVLSCCYSSPVRRHLSSFASPLGSLLSALREMLYRGPIYVATQMYITAHVPGKSTAPAR